MERSTVENITTIKSIYDAFLTADVETILGVVTDDADWAADTVSEAAPRYGPPTADAQGAGVASFLQDIGTAVEVGGFTPVNYAASGDEVHTLVRFQMTSRASASMNVHHYGRLRDGKVAYYRGSENTAQTAAMLAG